jgi:ribosomal peptide maturation radical SAM protein 1
MTMRHPPQETLSPRLSPSVALVSMPFVSAMRPSIQIGSLKSSLAAHGFEATTFHLYLDFAAQIGPATYEALCGHRGVQIGEWLFSRAAFGEAAPDVSARFISVFSPQLTGLLAELRQPPEFLLKLRDVDVPSYLDRMMSLINWEQFQVVGFTSTFQQNLASVALAARIKQKFPNICIVFGGANMEGDMGIESVRSMHCIDYAVSGEGDLAFPEFLAALREGRDPRQVPGIISRGDDGVKPPVGRPLLTKLDDLPVPDYREFFERSRILELDKGQGSHRTRIPFESSRGCWWGAKHHCTFCGLNGLAMQFRSKSGDRVLRELGELARRHHNFYFEAVDNIVDQKYLDGLFKEISQAGADYKIFYEVKANLGREQLRRLAQGGVHRIQPGIESLSTKVLRLMRKGTTSAQNINLLRWALYYGITVQWNLIWGFPGETERDYSEQVTLMRALTHLPSPVSAGRIWLERFSPLFNDRAAFPAVFIAPESSYSYVYPSSYNLEHLAYFFEYQFTDRLPDSAYAETAQAVEEWQMAWRSDVRPRLTFWYSPGYLEIYDSRSPGNARKFEFGDPGASLYAACSERARNPAALASSLQVNLTQHEIRHLLLKFVELGLMMRDGEHFLSLALPAIMGR